MNSPVVHEGNPEGKEHGVKDYLTTENKIM